MSKDNGKDMRKMQPKKTAGKKSTERSSVYASLEEMQSLGFVPEIRLTPEFLTSLPDYGRSDWMKPSEGLDLGRYIDLQREEQESSCGHSTLTKDLVALLQPSRPHPLDAFLRPEKRLRHEKESGPEKDSMPEKKLKPEKEPEMESGLTPDK